MINNNNNTNTNNDNNNNNNIILFKWYRYRCRPRNEARIPFALMRTPGQEDQQPTPASGNQLEAGWKIAGNGGN